MYKLYHNKNWRWCLSFSTFPKSAKGKKPYESWNYAYHNGIRYWKDSTRNCLCIALVIHLFMIVIHIPIGKEIGDCIG